MGGESSREWMLALAAVGSQRADDERDSPTDLYRRAMNRRRSLIVVSAFGVVMFIALVGLRKNSGGPERKVTTADSARSEGVAAPKVEPVGPTPAEPAKTAEQKYDEQVQEAVRGLNQPLRFWGKVVDQNGTPLAGVEVSYKARSARIPVFAALGSKESFGKTITGADGSFYIDAGKGDMLGLFGFTKEGYRLAQNSKTGFAYAGSPELHRPNAEQPVVFTMYEESAIEPLDHIENRFDLPCDGTPLTIELITGKPSDSGQLRVTLRREPLHIQPGRPFQWSARIEILGGGLQKADGQGAFIAPPEGYLPAVEYDFRPKNADWDPNWDRGIREEFYFRTSDAKYGRLEIRLHADSQPPPASLFVESWLNPSGSRHLEPRKSARSPAR